MASNKYGKVPDNEDALSRKLRKLELRYYLHSPYLWGIFIAVACALIFLFIPALNKTLITWSPGPLHSGHSVLEQNCAACHASSFKSVEDSSCLSCHQVSEHGGVLNKVNSSFNSEHLSLKHCGDCHIEHRDTSAFKPKETKLCTECHANLSSVVSHPENESFISFKEHAEFSLMINDKKVRLDDLNNLVEKNPLKFNHAVHLKPGLKGAEGKVTMVCNDCHNFSSTTKDKNNISFEKNCRSCHELSFDDRLPKSHVPHGNPEAVFQSLLGEYAKLLGIVVPQSTVVPENRRIPGRVGEKPLEQPVPLNLAIKEARESEELLFTKTSCRLCHQIERTNNSDLRSSNFEIKKPHIPEKWYTNANFSHSSHEIATCESCHVDVRKSKETSDILLPAIDNCRSCHIDSSSNGFVKSDCSMCHTYHSSRPLKPDNKKEIDELLKEFQK